MTALPLEAPFLKLASDHVPEPVRRLFREARLAEPPGSVANVHFDQVDDPAGVKTLLAFRASRPEINLFVLLSPALRETIPSRLDEIGAPLAWPGSTTPPQSPADPILEPEHPWWGPDRDDPGRCYSYGTDRFTAVDVIIDDLTATISIRARR